MTRRIVRTTRTIPANTWDPAPVETLPRREVEWVVRAEEDAPSYDENRALQRWIRGLENMTQSQLALLREFDFRLSDSEERNRRASNLASFERTWFWALWGILMLILGSVLVVLLVLILMSLIR